LEVGYHGGAGVIQPSIKTILVVEDDTDNREVLEAVIAMETPHRTLLMESGPEVL
jgi:CheY-like chemotaxis protein